jgi:hypothetical protein
MRLGILNDLDVLHQLQINQQVVWKETSII